MKIEKRTRTIKENKVIEVEVIKEVEVFVCDTCGLEFDKKYKAEMCEENHRQNYCPHKETKVELFIGEGICCINKRCNLCSKRLDEFYINEDLSQETLTEIYNILFNNFKKEVLK